MRLSRPTAIGLILFVLLACPPPAAADISAIIEWIHELSGPGLWGARIEWSPSDDEFQFVYSISFKYSRRHNLEYQDLNEERGIQSLSAGVWLFKKVGAFELGGAPFEIHTFFGKAFPLFLNSSLSVVGGIGKDVRIRHFEWLKRVSIRVRGLFFYPIGFNNTDFGALPGRLKGDPETAWGLEVRFGIR
jgi:hypothetical protein